MACAADDVGMTLSAVSACIVARPSSPRMASLAIASSMCARDRLTLSSRDSRVVTRALSRSTSASACDMSAGTRTGEGPGERSGLGGIDVGGLRGRGGGAFEATFDRGVSDGTGEISIEPPEERATVDGASS